MQAFITGLKEWVKSGSGFPMLTIQAAHPDNDQDKDKENLVALELIEKAMSDIVGKAYGQKICSTQKGSGQHGLFVVDFSGILTMLKAIQEHTNRKKAAKGWIRNWLKDKIKPEWLPSVKKSKKKHKEYSCRCGMIFRSKSSSKKAKRKCMRHQKRCAVLKELQQTLFARTKRMMKRNDDKTEKSTHQGKARQTKRSEAKRSSQKREHMDSGTKTRRSSRHHSKTKKR